MDWLAFISARVVIGAEFPVFFPVTREIGISETSSLVTASSSGESDANLRPRERQLLAPMGSGGGRTRTQLVLAQFEEARR